MLRLAGLAIVGTAALGALGTLGSDRWISAGYSTAANHVAMVGSHASVGDEAYWLNAARPKAVMPAATDMADHLVTRTFGIGTRLTISSLTISGTERLNLDIVSSTPVPQESGLMDSKGRPLILVTAREHKSTRIVRFLVEADAAPLWRGEKSL